MSDPVTQAVRSVAAAYVADRLDLSLIVEVPLTGAEPGLLYVGSLGDRSAMDYAGTVDDVVLVHEPKVPWTKNQDVRVAHFPFTDPIGPLPEGERLHIDLAVAYTETALYHGRRVAVICQRGRNRSALVAALALVRLWPQVPSKPIIEILRSKRGPLCLSNPHFVRIIANAR